MPHYKSPDGSLHFLDSADFAHLIPLGSVQLTSIEEANIEDRNSQVRAFSDLQEKAQAALDRTDAVALRCWKAGLAFPEEWQIYTNALRAIVRASDFDSGRSLPEQPVFPADT